MSFQSPLPKRAFLLLMNNTVTVLVSTQITNEQLALTAMQLVAGYSVLAKCGNMPSFEVVREEPHHIRMKKQFFEKNGTLFSEVENLDTVSYTHLTLPTICSV